MHSGAKNVFYQTSNKKFSCKVIYYGVDCCNGYYSLCPFTNTLKTSKQIIPAKTKFRYAVRQAYEFARSGFLKSSPVATSNSLKKLNDLNLKIFHQVQLDFDFLNLHGLHRILILSLYLPGELHLFPWQNSNLSKIVSVHLV